MSKEEDKHARFMRLTDAYSTDMYRYAMWMCGNQALAKDLVQEALLRAWKALDKLQDDSAAKSWLFTIVRREFYRTFEKKVPPLVDVDDVVIEDEQQITPESDSEVTILRREIAKLPKKYREPLLLQVVGGYSCQEIADKLDISRNAVMTQLFRAREKLKTAMT